MNDVIISALSLVDCFLFISLIAAAFIKLFFMFFGVCERYAKGWLSDGIKKAISEEIVNSIKFTDIIIPSASLLLTTLIVIFTEKSFKSLWQLFAIAGAFLLIVLILIIVKHFLGKSMKGDINENN